MSISINFNLFLLGAGNSAPKEKESSKREKLKDRENEHVFVQQSSTAVHRSPRSLGELQIRFDFNVFRKQKLEKVLTQYLRYESKGWSRDENYHSTQFPSDFQQFIVKINAEAPRGKPFGIDFTKSGSSRAETGYWSLRLGIQEFPETLFEFRNKQTEIQFFNYKFLLRMMKYLGKPLITLF